MSFRPWLLLPPKLAHDLSPYALNTLKCFLPKPTKSTRSLNWRGLQFPNPMGLAGGVDKNVEQVEAWYKLGCGFIEVGTITPRPQGPNPGKIMDRDSKHKAVWNKMGFPNKGLEKAKSKLQALPRPFAVPLFANIGKNRNTPNESSAEDYKKCIIELEGLVDAFVVNISSPNTKNLRDLLEPETLKPFLMDVLSARTKNTPTLLKLSPDLEEDVLKNILSVSVEANIDGWIFTNTTLNRPPGIPFPPEGGLSGQPLAESAKNILKKSLEFLGDSRQGRLVISTGGIMSGQDAKERLELGADLVQVYSALIFKGPFFYKKALQDLA